MTDEERRARQRENRKRWNAQNPDKVAAHKRRYNAKNAEDIAYYKACYAEENSERLAAKRREWLAANPDKVRAQRQRLNRKGARPHNRRLTIALCKDKEALARRVVEKAEAAVARNLPEHVRSGVVALLVERVYSGLLPIRLTSEHGKAALADYRRDVERFALQHVSLDQPVGDDGATFGQVAGFY